MPGKKGNLNALRHGLYAQYYDAAEVAQLRKMGISDFEFEAAALRVVIAKLLKLAKSTDELDQLTRAANSLSNAMVSLCTVARTSYLLVGMFDPLADALKDALVDEPFYLVDNQGENKVN